MAMTIDKATEKISNLLFSISKIGQLPIEKNFNSEYLMKKMNYFLYLNLWKVIYMM